ncbi:MAG: 4Fe-4S dicluster domain-containing protein [Nitrososphaerota archaeon]|nr:4Fe-4S dicluster domain-containing protein [Nitrososphaerota archaeon]
MKLSMAIDLAKCIGCDACSVACKIENSTPDGIWWAPVIQREVGKYPKARTEFLPTLCMHCEDPPCQKSCPTKAIGKRKDGIVWIDEGKCTGSRSCVSACPYNAISVWEMKARIVPQGEFETPVAIHPESKHKVGAAQKCTFCVHRMDIAEAKGLKIGIDRDASPACVITCPANCRIFGDVNDVSSPVSKYIEEAEKAGRTVFALRPDARTRPKVAYVW